MFSQLTRITTNCRTLNYSRILPRRNVSSRNIGIRSVRIQDKEGEECPYNTFKWFNVETKERCHSFNIPCDRVVQFIKLGAINKQIAMQYCHYLAELTRASTTPDDVAYFEIKCADLMSFLLRNVKELPATTVFKLLSDVADTTKQNCSIACSRLLESPNWNSGFQTADFAKILGSCYKFGLWDTADEIIDRAPELVTYRLSEYFAAGVISASREYKNLNGQVGQPKVIRLKVITSLTKLCRNFASNRTQMITKQKDDFIQALKDLDLKIKINPTIKMSGRCTSCNSHLPLFDHKLVSTINSAIKSQVNKGSEKGLYLNSSPNDVNRFELFLRELYEKDKRPIDCVIDGLNIAYRSSIGFSVYQQNLTPDISRTFKVPKPESQSNVLINCIIRGDMLKHFRKILVVGKWHMTKWPGLTDFFHKHNIHFYTSYNNSKDDLFQLFAATLNPKTVLVTNDFLRDHLAQLSGDDRTMLERWIDTHQAWICQRSLKPIWPTPYEKIPCANPEGDVFHLPVIDFNQLDTVGVYEPPPHLSNKILTWVCCDTRDQLN